MILVLTDVFAEADDLRRARFSRDVESSHLDAGGRSRLINYRPHRFNDYGVLIFGNAEVLWFNVVKGPACARRSIVRAARISADCINRTNLFHEMRNVHFAFHPDGRMCAQQSKRREHVFALAER